MFFLPLVVIPYLSIHLPEIFSLILLSRLLFTLLCFDFFNGLLLLWGESEDRPNRGDQEGDNESAPDGIEHGDDPSKYTYREDVAIANCSHCDHYIPDRGEIGVKHSLTLTLIGYPLKNSD